MSNDKQKAADAAARRLRASSRALRRVMDAKSEIEKQAKEAGKMPDGADKDRAVARAAKRMQAANADVLAATQEVKDREAELAKHDASTKAPAPAEKAAPKAKGE